ncbi:MAG: hypothetical protein K9W44_07195 [Candidatus Lokiarchaeota archaeon]|nr:hypothetical protein [Candidatus Harpocratesius repetitus]
MDILLIDNDLVNQDRIVQLILQIDPTHDVFTAHSSVDAQRLLRKQKFDIILTEIYLTGGLQGNELIYEVDYDCFKIGMANFLETPQIRMAFNEFLIKPITKEMLQDILKKAQYNLDFLKQFQ